MQRAFIYIILFILVSLAGNFAADFTSARQIAERSPFYLGFASIGAISLESRLDAWAKLEANSNENEMKDQLKSILKSLNTLPANGRTSFDRQGKICRLHFVSLNRGVSYEITISSNQEARVTDFIVGVKSQDSKVNLQDIGGKLKTAGPMEWKTYYFYAGKLPEPLNEAAQQELIKVLIKPFQGQLINHYSDERMTVTTAYSPLLKVESVGLDGSRCNLQASVRRDDINKVTYVYLGSPLILGDY